MSSFFSGWIGYGTGVQAGTLLEPSDTSYARRRIQFSALENRMTFDVGGGTVGPASVSWGALSIAGLFDAQSGGNLLLVSPLQSPAIIAVGGTYTTGPRSNVFVGVGQIGGSGTESYPAGAVIGVTSDGRQWVTNVAVQISAGVLSAQTPSFGTTVTMATLPAQQPTTGSGQLWNNGGIISVA